MDTFIPRALRLAGRPMTLAELAALKFGSFPNDAQRKATKAAALRLVDLGVVTLTKEPLTTARGQEREQNVVTLADREPVRRPVPVAIDEISRAGRTPAALFICSADNSSLLAEDQRATHEYLRTEQWSAPLLLEHADECDDECRRHQCIVPAPGCALTRAEVLERPEVREWLRQHPHPLIWVGDGELLEVLPGRGVSEVVDALAAEVEL